MNRANIEQAESVPPSGCCEIWFFTSELEGQRAGSFRQERWCYVFLDLGHPVTIFNITGFAHLNISSFSTRAQFAAFRTAQIELAKPRASVREGLVARFLRRIKHLTLADLYLPNVAMLVIQASRRTRFAKTKLVLMASSPPFSTALAASFVKRMFPDRITFAVDMRDAWALHRALGGLKTIKRFVEQSVLKSADSVSTVSIGLKEEFDETYDLDVFVLYNVATHYFNISKSPRIDWFALNPHITAAKIKIVYTGSTPQGFYDVATLARAIGRLRRTDPKDADRIQFIFIGACAEVQQEARKQAGVENDIIFLPGVTHAEAKAIQQNADALLFLGYYGVGVVSTKIFEYLALCKPILPLFVTHQSDVDQLLLRYGGKSCHLYTEDEIVGILKEISQSGVDAVLPRQTDVMAVQELFAAYQPYGSRLIEKSSVRC